MKTKALFWTKDTPAVIGFYFFRQGDRIDVCKVYEMDIDYGSFQENTEWAGPIPEPRDKG